MKQPIGIQKIIIQPAPHFGGPYQTQRGSMTGCICEVCGGTGLECFICNKDEENDLEFIPIYDFEACPVCQGRGYIVYGEV